jgi:hypothetical protein
MVVPFNADTLPLIKTVTFTRKFRSLKKMWKYLAVLTLTLFMAGCQTIGAKSIEYGRSQFNKSIVQTNQEQTLLNLVRLRYRDQTYTLQVASVTSSLEYGVAAGGSGSFPKASPNTYGLSMGGSYTEKPTISYVPLTGENLVNQMMTPISPKTMLILHHSGWSVSRILRIIAQEINGLENANTAAGPTPSHEPEFREFKRVAQLMRELEINDGLELGFSKSESGDLELILIIHEDHMDTPQAKELYQLLNLSPEKNIFPIGSAKGKDRIQVITRSLVGCFFFVSQAVNVPQKDEEKGLVTVTEAVDGGRFDWNEVTEGIMNIQSSTGRFTPKDAYIHVYYRGKWFYIADNDLPSKSTFLMLNQLFSILGGNVKASAPVLTLSAN